MARDRALPVAEPLAPFFPDGVIVRIIVAENDAELLSGFEAAVRRYR